MNETFALYLFTRLDSLKSLFGFGAFILCIAAIGLLGAAVLTAESDHESDKQFHGAAKKLIRPTVAAIALAAIVNTFLPSKNDAIFIVAGTGVIEAAKSDGVQRVAGKAAAVVEKALDDYLAKGDKK